jgi:hypothetical protein
VLSIHVRLGADAAWKKSALWQNSPITNRIRMKIKKITFFIGNSYFGHVPGMHLAAGCRRRPSALPACVVSIIVPGFMIWWKNGPRHRTKGWFLKIEPRD